MSSEKSQKEAKKNPDAPFPDLKQTTTHANENATIA